MPVSVADVYRVYAKRSTGKVKGALIFRKKGVIRRSGRVRQRNIQFGQAKIATRAKELCLNWSGCWYTDEYGERRCYIECFVRALRQAAQEAGLTSPERVMRAGIAATVGA